MINSPNTNLAPDLTPEALGELISRFGERRILVLGDVMLDEYISGDVRRISPEAPVPIVHVSHKVHLPGGAANVASNIASLSGIPKLVAVIGDDEGGVHLRATLESNHVSTESLIVANERPTITKTRIVSGQQQIVRLDREVTSPFSDAHVNAIVAAFDRHIADVDACLLSDYAKGLLTGDVCRHAISRARQLQKPVIVDPKGASFLKYSGCTVITPNLRETEVASGLTVQSEADLFRAVTQLQSALQDAAVLVTRGADGMTLFRDNVEVLHAPALAREVFDVTGAGDTVVGTLTLALASGATLEQAVLLANMAASVVVQKTGTATVSADELATANALRENPGETTARRTSRFFRSAASQPLITQ